MRQKEEEEEEEELKGNGGREKEAETKVACAPIVLSIFCPSPFNHPPVKCLWKYRHGITYPHHRVHSLVCISVLLRRCVFKMHSEAEQDQKCVDGGTRKDASPSDPSAKRLCLPCLARLPSPFLVLHTSEMRYDTIRGLNGSKKESAALCYLTHVKCKKQSRRERALESWPKSLAFIPLLKGVGYSFSLRIHSLFLALYVFHPLKIDYCAWSCTLSKDASFFIGFVFLGASMAL